MDSLKKRKHDIPTKEQLNQYQTDLIIYGTIPKVIGKQKSKVEEENEEVQNRKLVFKIKTKSKTKKKKEGIVQWTK